MRGDPLLKPFHLLSLSLLLTACGSAPPPVVAPTRHVIKIRSASASSDLRTMRGGKHLLRCHPSIKRRAIALYQQAEAAGIPIKFISGYRRFGGKRASWHHFGMAIDVNLVTRSNMKDALNHWGSDEHRWAKIGKIGKALGFTWGLAWRRSEVFHFEWHPGMPSGIRGKARSTLLKEAGSKALRIEATWWRFPKD